MKFREIARNVDIGLFTKPSMLTASHSVRFQALGEIPEWLQMDQLFFIPWDRAGPDTELLLSRRKSLRANRSSLPNIIIESVSYK